MNNGRSDRSSTAAALGISTKAFELVRSLVEARTGLAFPVERAALLADKLTDIVARRGLQSYLDLYYLLRYDEDQEALWKEMADHLAVPETFFWRQPEQLLALREILPPILRQLNGRPARIWSAACCSGEEPLSIAMALDAIGIPADRVEIVASDASPRLLDRARAGIYSDRSLSRLPENLRVRYFTREGSGWRVDPELHRRVDLRLANLVDSAQTAPLAHADVIYCRNVFIYFSDDTVREVVDSFERAMPEHGTLFLGAAESLVRITGRLRLEEVAGAFLYRKAAAEASRPLFTPSLAKHVP